MIDSAFRWIGGLIKDTLDIKNSPKNSYSYKPSQEINKVLSEKISDRIRNNNQNLLQGNLTFINFVQDSSREYIEENVNSVYDSYASKYGDVSLGEAGAIEFVAAIMLANFDKTTTSAIKAGIRNIFRKDFSPLDFSNYLDEIVHKSNVPYSIWSEVYRYLKANHYWIQNHLISRDANILNSQIGDIVHQSPIKNTASTSNVKLKYKLVDVINDNRQRTIKYSKVNEEILAIKDENNVLDSNAVIVKNLFGQELGNIIKDETSFIRNLMGDSSSIKGVIKSIYGGGTRKRHGSSSQFYGVIVEFQNNDYTDPLMNSKKMTFEECFKKYFPFGAMMYAQDGNIENRTLMLLRFYDGSYELDEPMLGALIMHVKLGNFTNYNLEELLSQLNMGKEFENDVMYNLTK